jgi:hypothetical protein
LLLALAATQPRWERPTADESVTVMVDLSASTRSAIYRDRAALDKRLDELLGRHPYRLIYFADGAVKTGPSGDRLTDLPSRITEFAPPAGGSVVLFSDGQFELPAIAAPTLVVVDVGLDNPADARVMSLNAADGMLNAAIVNRGSPRGLHWQGTASSAPASATTGDYSLSASLSAGASQAILQISPGDAWPENDAMTAIVPPPAKLQRWWVGAGPVPTGWTAVSPADLLAQPADLLRAGVIALHDLPADDLSAGQQAQLEHYVRDLGGTLFIFGGRHAFAAGGYAQTTLDALSPLASNPPRPTKQWVILTDASGSMAAATADGTRLDRAVAAIESILLALPPDDTVTIGSFAGDIRWWSSGKSVRGTLGGDFRPVDAVPTGPTNLSAVLSSLSTDSTSRTLVLITDGGAGPVDSAKLSAQLKASSSSLELLLIGQGPAADSLQRIAQATGGHVLYEKDPAQWAKSAKVLARSAGDPQLETTPAHIRFVGNVAGNGLAVVSPWNRTWLKKEASVFALSDEGDPLAAWWQVGNGRVAALAFDPMGHDQPMLDLMDATLTRPPRDDRFTIHWSEQAGQVTVQIVADDKGKPFNDAALSLLGTVSEPIPQIAPGEYALTFDAPRQAMVVAIAFNGNVIDRHALAGHYPAEFSAIGNNYANLHQLAKQTGGRLIGPADHSPIDLPRHLADISLTPLLCILAAGSIAGALLIMRRA